MIPMDIIEEVRKELKSQVEEDYRKGAFRYFKEQVKPYGVRSHNVRSIARKYFPEFKKLGFKNSLGVCEKFIKSGWLEEGTIVFEVIMRFRKEFGKESFRVFEKWIDRYVHNWSHCDGISAWLIGFSIKNDPDLVKNLFEWTKSENRWKRRASAVSLVTLTRKGLFVKDAFKIADLLLDDKDDMVQKGVGWMLKESSRTRQKDVIDFIEKRKHKIPRTMLRYAIEKMLLSVRKGLMEK